MHRIPAGASFLWILLFTFTANNTAWIPAPTQASTDVRTASAQRPQLALEQRADISMARKAYADAVDYYIRALAQSRTGNSALWNKLGIAYQQQTDYHRARKAYNEAIHHQKDFAEAWNNLGTLYYMEGKYRKSLKYYKRALRLKPDSASFHLNLGSSYVHLKKTQDALEEYHAALALDPNCLSEHSTLGTVIQTRAANVEFYFYLAKVFASLGRVDDAVRYLRRAFEDGLKDHKRLEDDPDFQKISHDPAYVQLISNPPVPIED